MAAVDGTQEDAERIALDEQHRAEVLADDSDAPKGLPNRYTPSAVTDAAVEVAARTFFPNLQASMKAPISASVRTDMREALTAALPYLTGPTYDRAFQRGVNIGRAEAEVEAINSGPLGTYPTDYEVWRDALTLAVTEGMAVDDDGVSSAVVLARAQWFHKQLQQVPVQQQAETCPDCQGEDGNHFTGCVVSG